MPTSLENEQRRKAMGVSPQQQVQIEKQKEESNQTGRVVSQELEKILYDVHPVLDRGFVRVVDYMGNDESIVQAARVSYGKGTKKSKDDEGLIRYLMRHRHTTPFEMCEIKLHVKLPIFVARQWIRHRTASVNEYSARYSILENEFYIPDPDQLSVQSMHNRQGRGNALTKTEAAKVIEVLKKDSSTAYEHYEEMLSDEEKSGLSREIARINLPVNIYTQWYWKANLHNLLRFVSLRSDGHAQYEIRAYANVISEIVRRWVPMASRAFEDYVINGAQFSSAQMKSILALIELDEISKENSGMSQREWQEMMDTLSNYSDDQLADLDPTRINS